MGWGRKGSHCPRHRAKGGNQESGGQVGAHFSEGNETLPLPPITHTHIHIYTCSDETAYGSDILKIHVPVCAHSYSRYATSR